MPAFVKFNCFPADLGLKKHDLNADTLRVFLTNSTPNVATNAVLSDLTDLSTANGYTAGGEDVQNAYSQSGGIGTLTGVDITWTASGDIGPYRYAVLYNDDSATNALIGYWDLTGGGSWTTKAGETLKHDIGASILTIA